MNEGSQTEPNAGGASLTQASDLNDITMEVQHQEHTVAHNIPAHKVATDSARQFSLYDAKPPVRVELSMRNLNSLNLERLFKARGNANNAQTQQTNSSGTMKRSRAEASSIPNSSQNGHIDSAQSSYGWVSPKSKRTARIPASQSSEDFSFSGPNRYSFLDGSSEIERSFASYTRNSTASLSRMPPPVDRSIAGSSNFLHPPTQPQPGAIYSQDPASRESYDWPPLPNQRGSTSRPPPQDRLTQQTAPAAAPPRERPSDSSNTDAAVQRSNEATAAKHIRPPPIHTDGTSSNVEKEKKAEFEQLRNAKLNRIALNPQSMPHKHIRHNHMSPNRDSPYIARNETNSWNNASGAANYLFPSEPPQSQPSFNKMLDEIRNQVTSSIQAQLQSVVSLITLNSQRIDKILNFLQHPNGFPSI
ncbi:hypothetical protein QAD02_008017 [Eretmocerus hayati]|uniref:Uncharacterized protein n=1 Tax=Eretmocerus hayati TaxID=131215 RepID=A0ACC2N589_9HYME|nr:hypothetical protein QAD02_008017 [Eretmocerus hayati]